MPFLLGEGKVLGSKTHLGLCRSAVLSLLCALAVARCAMRMSCARLITKVNAAPMPTPGFQPVPQSSWSPLPGAGVMPPGTGAILPVSQLLVPS